MKGQGHAIINNKLVGKCNCPAQIVLRQCSSKVGVWACFHCSEPRLCEGKSRRRRVPVIWVYGDYASLTSPELPVRTLADESLTKAEEKARKKCSGSAANCSTMGPVRGSNARLESTPKRLFPRLISLKYWLSKRVGVLSLGTEVTACSIDRIEIKRGYESPL
ncbi:hypothetical protein AKJ16_DCAP05579 [Drosera capensis]